MRVSVPGPRLTVPAGQGLTVNIINELPEPVSIVIPGQALPLALGATAPSVARNRGRPHTVVRARDARRRSAAWPARPCPTSGRPSSPERTSTTAGRIPRSRCRWGSTARQRRTRSRRRRLTPAEAYAGVPFDAEALLIYSEIDPALHAAVAGPATYGTAAYPSTLDYQPKYFLVNGAVADSAAAAATVAPASRLLLRFVNAGLKEHAPQVLGSYVSAVAEDGKPYPYAEAARLAAAGGRARPWTRSWSRQPREPTRSSTEGSTGRTCPACRGLRTPSSAWAIPT